MKGKGRISVIVLVLVIVASMLTLFGCSKKDDGPVHPLSNPNVTARTQKLYDYIWSTYGNHILSGQQESTWMDGGNTDYEMEYIFENTGKLPAIRGLDFIEDDFDGVVERAKAWAEKGGIVTICWHCSSSFDAGYDECKADTLTEEQWTAMLTEGTPEHEAALAGMDKAGRALQKLKEANIPVLWRPFHEFDGKWFWWGKKPNASEHFKKLWVMMYDHFTNDLHLDNLIWVLGYSYIGTHQAEYYPGDEYCDIVGGDSYYVIINRAEKRLYDSVYAVVGDRKPIAFHEVGLMPTAEEFQGVPWAWFMTWHTNYLVEDPNDVSTNQKADLNALYNSDYVITLDELPNLYE